MAVKKAGKKGAVKRKSAKRQYSDAEKAETLAALDANGGNVSHTARQLGIPRVTLLEWSKGRKQHPVVSEMRQEKKEALSDRLEEVAHALLDNILHRAQGEHSPMVPLKDFATSFGIVVDKMQLLKGEPTAITQGIPPEQKRQRVKEWMSKEGILTTDKVQ